MVVHSIPLFGGGEKAGVKCVLLVPTASIAWGLILSGTIPICRMSSVVCRLSVKWALFLNRLR